MMTSSLFLIFEARKKYCWFMDEVSTGKSQTFRIVYLPRVDELAEIQEKMTRFLAQYRR